jgi:aspartyl-tRNA(Asn)/glutamyl-tRNA(Gln) amidotransferase subunit C
MALTPEEVRNVGHLARLALADDEVERLTHQLNDLLDQFARLQELDTDEVPTTSHAVAVQAALREDEVRPSLPREAVLALSKNVDEYLGGFIVPQVIGES